MYDTKPSNQFRECMKNLPTGVTVVSTLVGSVYHGITINSFTAVSLEPPMVLFCIKKNTVLHKILIDSKYFTVNILTDEQVEISKLFTHPNIESWQDKFTSNNKCILQNCLAYLYSKVDKIYTAGDHDIIIGQVIEMQCLSNSLPLVYYNRKYCNISQ